MMIWRNDDEPFSSLLFLCFSHFSFHQQKVVGTMQLAVVAVVVIKYTYLYWYKLEYGFVSQ